MEPVGLFQRRAGLKFWPAPVIFLMQEDGSYLPSEMASFLGRGGYWLVAWSDKKIGLDNRSQHNGAYWAIEKR